MPTQVARAPALAISSRACAKKQGRTPQPCVADIACLRVPPSTYLTGDARHFQATSAQTAQNGEWRMDQQLRESQARVLELAAEKTAQNAELDFAKATVPELASRLRDLLASSR